MGSGRSLSRRREGDAVAKDAAMERIQPRAAVAPTPRRMAMGAARAAPAVSSAMWAAESSAYRASVAETKTLTCYTQPVSVHMGAVKASRKAQPSVHCQLHVRRCRVRNALFAHPVLFSNEVNATFVGTRWLPAHTSRAMMAATVVPTAQCLMGCSREEHTTRH